MDIYEKLMQVCGEIKSQVGLLKRPTQRQGGDFASGKIKARKVRSTIEGQSWAVMHSVIARPKRAIFENTTTKMRFFH